MTTRYETQHWLEIAGEEVDCDIRCGVDLEYYNGVPNAVLDGELEVRLVAGGPWLSFEDANVTAGTDHATEALCDLALEDDGGRDAADFEPEWD